MIIRRSKFQTIQTKNTTTTTKNISSRERFYYNMSTWYLQLVLCNSLLIAYCNNQGFVFGYIINRITAINPSKLEVIQVVPGSSSSLLSSRIKTCIQIYSQQQLHQPRHKQQQYQHSITVCSLYNEKRTYDVNDKMDVINDTNTSPHQPSSSSSSVFDNYKSHEENYYYWNEAQLLSYANEEGIRLSLSKVGPLIRAVARSQLQQSSLSSSSSAAATVEAAAVEATYQDSNDSNNNSETSNNNIILGYVEGFIRPSSFLSPTNTILHLDQMIVYQKQIDRIRINDPNFRNGGTILGIGLLLGYLCILDYVESNSSKNVDKRNLLTEFLAIDDETYQHLRLVKYYTMAGFSKIKYVGNEFNDISDRLIWGGCGTLLRQNCILLLHKWTILLERSRKRRTKN
jgi:hypothetical protein